MNFESFSPDTEITGRSMALAIKTLNEFNIPISDYLKKHGLGNFDPEGWYNEQTWLNILKEISVDYGPNTIFTLGKGVGSHMPELNVSFKDLLISMHKVYHENHRGSTSEYSKLISFEEGARKATMKKHNPYPPEYARGLLLAMVRKFKPDSFSFPKVQIEEVPEENAYFLHIVW